LTDSLLSVIVQFLSRLATELFSSFFVQQLVFYRFIFFWPTL